jgi:hypothetical protein
MSLHVGPEGDRAPGDPSEFANEPWFRFLYANVEEWYRGRYAARMDGRETSIFKAVMLIASTPFELHVPMTASRPDIPADSS